MLGLRADGPGGLDARGLRRDGPGHRVVLAHEDTFGVLQQGEGAISASVNEAELRHRDAPSVGVLGQAALVPEIVAMPKMIGGSIAVVPLQTQLAHSHVQVGRSA